jgi:hypothetical protein
VPCEPCTASARLRSMPGGPARSPPLCVWTLPPGDDDFSSRWRLIKTIFARSLAADERRSDARRRHQERGIWQRRFWEPSIRDDSDFAAHGFQTRLCRGGRRLAVFHVQGLRSARALSCRLASTVGTNPIRQRSRGMTPFGGLRFALNPPYYFNGRHGQESVYGIAPSRTTGTTRCIVRDTRE